MQRIECCKGCDDRHAGCHSKCDSYIKERTRLDALNKERYQEKNVMDFIDYRHKKKRR